MEAKQKAKEKLKQSVLPDAPPVVPDKAIEISIKMADGTLTTNRSQGVDEAVSASNVVSQDGSGKQLRITFETSDKKVSAQSSAQTTGGEAKDKQVADSEQAQQENMPVAERESAPGENISTAVDNGDDKGSSTSGRGVTPPTSDENVSPAEDSNKTQAQLSPEHNDKKPDGETKSDERITDGTEGATNDSKDVQSSIDIKNLTLDNVSDDGLEWSSDIDMPLSVSSDPSSDSDLEKDQPEAPPVDSSNKPADDIENDPWNAVCVFGLRVYSKGSQAEIEVVKQDDELVSSKKLDVDDQAADATKKLQKGTAREEQQLEKMGTAPAWDEDSKQG